MGSMKGNEIGLAGEFRVMSELLLRGHNPAKSYLENGADIVLENSIKVEVKSAHRLPQKRTSSYLFNLRRKDRKGIQNLDNCDFVVCWCINDDSFYIIPKSVITSTSIGIYNLSSDSKSKYTSYKDKWELLKRG